MHAERDPMRLVCRWKSGRGRWEGIPVGAELTARLAARLYELLPDDGQPVARPALIAGAEGIGLEGAALPGLLWTMRRYDVVRFSGERL
jgi:hypothetical protein